MLSAICLHLQITHIPRETFQTTPLKYSTFLMLMHILLHKQRIDLKDGSFVLLTVAWIF